MQFWISVCYGCVAVFKITWYYSSQAKLSQTEEKTSSTKEIKTTQMYSPQTFDKLFLNEIAYFSFIICSQV